MIVLSLQDLFFSLRKNKKKLLFFSCFGGALFFFYALIKPLTYTAQATYNHSSQAPSQKDPLSKLLGKSASSSPPGLLYYPVLEKCVKRLHLQGTLIIPHKEENCSIRKKLKAEAIYLTLFTLSPNKKAPIAPLLQEKSAPLAIDSLFYKGDFTSYLKIRFIDDEKYQVKAMKGDLIGEGSIDQPFFWDEHSFILIRENKKIELTEKEYILKLLPLAIATHKLQKNIIVKKDKLNDSLYHIRTNHFDRHFAAKLVNTLIDEYQIYLREKGEKCSQSQLNYLKKRKEEAKKQIEETMLLQKQQIENNIADQELAFFEQELEFVNKQQTLLFAKQKSLLEEIEVLQENYEPEKSSLSLELLQEQILQYQLRIEELNFEVQQCEDCLLKLNLEGLELPPKLYNVTLQPHYTKLELLQDKLLNRESYSNKERFLLEEQMKIEKRLLEQAIYDVKKSSSHEIASLEQQLHILKKKKLFALIIQSENTEKELYDLGLLAKKLPIKWLKNEEVKQAISMEEGCIKTLSQLVENNTLNEQIAPLYSYPLHLAFPPSLVNPPKLILFFAIGLFSGAFFTFIFYMLQEAFKGPTASKENLRHYGFTHFGTFSTSLRLNSVKKREQQTLLSIVHGLEESSIILFNQKSKSSLPELLLQKRGKSCLIDLVNKKVTREEGVIQYLLGQTKGVIPLIQEDKYDKMVLGHKEFHEELLLLQNDFILLLQSLKQEYAQLLILCEKPLSHPLLQKLSLFADKSLFALKDERMSDLALFDPKKVYFFTQDESSAKESHRPLLDKLYHKIKNKQDGQGRQDQKRRISFFKIQKKIQRN